MKKRLWFNTKMAQAKIIEFNEIFDEFNKKRLLKTIQMCDFNTLRLICNAVDKSAYSEFKTIFSNVPYDEMREIKKALNERVNAILCDYAKLYDHLMESQKHERWNGDERYKLLGYDLPPYADRQVIKTLVKIVCEYLDKPLTVEHMSEIAYLNNHGMYWTLTKEVHSIDYPNWETNDDDFKVLNNSRKRECEAWYTFMKLIYEGEYKRAYAIMTKNGTDK